MTFLVGLFVSGTVFYLLSLLFPYPGLGEYEKVDVFETFTSREAASLGVVPVGDTQMLDGAEFGPGDQKMCEMPNYIVESEIWFRLSSMHNDM
jgi:NCS1 family nucleobase:cation symporter-1